VRKNRLNKLAKDEKGQTLIIVVLLMLVSALVIAPMLSNVGSGLKTGKDVYEEKMQLFYSADSGVEDGLWQIKSENLDVLFTSPAYDPYDFDQIYEYPASLDVNGNDVEVKIENIWIPKDITAPGPISARDIIEGVDLPRLVISGGVSAASTYQIKIAYYYDADTDPDGTGLDVNTIGIWLPPGFEYAGNCSLEDETYYPTPVDEAYCSGRAVVWNFSSVPLVNFPDLGGSSASIERSFTFQFSGPVNVNPGAALSWINTSIGYAWDANVKVYKVTSTATDDNFDPPKQTVVEAYTAKSEMRQLGSTISGDYVAVGNSLITGDPDYRNQLLKESSATIQNSNAENPGYIPANATVEGAYLYWSGFIDHYYWKATTITSGHGHGHHTTTTWSWSLDTDNGTGLMYPTNPTPADLETLVETNAMVNTVNFGSVGAMQDITTHQWAVWPKTNDSPACWYYTCLYDATDLVKTPVEDAIKSSGSGTYTFTLGHASQGTTSVINLLKPGYPGEPGSNDESNYYSFTLCNGSGHSTSDYTGYPLGTPAHMLPNGESSYKQRYNASYAGWSMVIIYSTPDMKGHQLYLYDISDPNFMFKESYPEGASQSNPDFDGDGEPGGNISGFLVPQPITGETDAAKITCFVGEGDEDKTGDSFKVTGLSGTGEYLLDGTGAPWNNVWNSMSLGANASGVDIDTFYIPWGTPPSSGILRPGDTSAQIDIPTTGDGFTLSYIIVSFRSDITSGGTISYLIRG